ncbi:hypothetical protein [Roseivirga misakiensis]|uniref:Uncharacterized protein n=1 Tax=Roseivirga misakiensis TaxID=1563681 RepID=A0A1E5T6J6_9BACT|nr:hypothetical protein [Roseivirga misakiensis]OEK06968.1 hypothetical protein BFP71_04740 [Roseivirga misakiensis]
MIKTFTQDDLVRYIYNETSAEEGSEIEIAMLFDEKLAETYAELSTVVGDLNGALKSPTRNTIDSIISYSKSYHLHSVD